jgi:hypothetical protein
VSEPSISFDSVRKEAFAKPAVALAGAGLMAAAILFLVLRYAVAIPMLDDWEMVSIVTKAHTGSLKFADLFEQQQEARPFFPKLIFIALSSGKYWDSRSAMMLSILICCLTTLGIYRLLGRSLLSTRTTLTVFLLSALLVFSPAQHEIWLLASGFPSFAPAVCILWGIYFATSDRPIATRFWLCLALSVCASFTLANGLLAWGLTFPCLLFAPAPARPAKRWFAYWLIALALCAAAYFWHLRPPNDTPAFAPGRSLFEYGQYIAAFLGSGLGRSGNDHPLGYSTVIGMILLFGYAAAVLCVILRHRDHGLRVRALPWIALGGYSIGSACLAALGRIEWGVAQALESRYVAFSIYLAVAVIVLIPICAGEFLKTPGAPRRRIVVFSLATLLASGCFILDALCAVDSVAFFRVRSAAARLGDSAVLFGLAIDTSQTIKNVNYPQPRIVRENAEALERLHLLRTPLVRTDEIAKLRHAEADNRSAAGWCDGLTIGVDGSDTAWGWAALPARNRPADGVLLAYANGNGDWIAFALSDAVVSRPDVTQTLRSAEQLWSGWRTVFLRNLVPKGAEISAWAVDAKEAKLYRLKTTARLLNP